MTGILLAILTNAAKVESASREFVITFSDPLLLTSASCKARLFFQRLVTNVHTVFPAQHIVEKQTVLPSRSYLTLAQLRTLRQ